MVHELRFLFRHCGHALNEGINFLSTSELQDMIMNLQTSVIIFSHASSLPPSHLVAFIEEQPKLNVRFILGCNIHLEDKIPSPLFEMTIRFE